MAFIQLFEVQRSSFPFLPIKTPETARICLIPKNIRFSPYIPALSYDFSEARST